MRPNKKEELKEALGKFEQAKKSDDLLSGVSYLKKKIVLVIPIDRQPLKGVLFIPNNKPSGQPWIETLSVSF